MDNKTSGNIDKFLLSVLEKRLKLIKAYLFGSYAKGDFTKDSDIDIALVFDGLKDNERFDTQVDLMMLSSEFDSRIEPHPISIKDFNLNNPFASEIINTGIELDFKRNFRKKVLGVAEDIVKYDPDK
jgi:uncharacterized protein